MQPHPVEDAVIRILVTGSRHWTDEARFDQNIRRYISRYVGTDDAVIVHGAAEGLDTVAAEWAANNGYFREAHYADWDHCNPDWCTHRPTVNQFGQPYCPAAGIIRNQQMVDSGADVCLAFPLGESRGTRDCMRRASAAGIPVWVCSGDVVRVRPDAPPERTGL